MNVTTTSLPLDSEASVRIAVVAVFSAFILFVAAVGTLLALSESACSGKCCLKRGRRALRWVTLSSLEQQEELLPAGQGDQKSE